MPNYVSRVWTRTPNGLAALLLGRSEVTINVQGKPVVITEETDYPFRDTITFRIKVATPVTFAFSVRIPEWCDNASVSVNGVSTPAAAKAGTFVALDRRFSNGDVVVHKLPMSIRTREWFGGRAGSVERGPLVYALKIVETVVSSREDSPALARALKGQHTRRFPCLTARWRAD